MRCARAAAAVLGTGGSLLLAGSCAVTNYPDPARPYYETRHGVARDPEPGLRVVTFNVEKGRRVAEAARALGQHPDLRHADVVVLQEMSGEGVAAVARALRMNSAYHPASREPLGGPDWGNAVLSPWPIEDARKVRLPHRSRFNSEDLGRLFERNGYCWPTRGVGPTVDRFSVDHVFARGVCAAPRGLRAGVARDVSGASDHRPVWALLGGMAPPVARAR